MMMTSVIMAILVTLDYITKLINSYVLSNNSWQTITIATVNMQITTRHRAYYIKYDNKSHFAVITFHGRVITFCENGITFRVA